MRSQFSRAVALGLVLSAAILLSTAAGAQSLTQVPTLLRGGAMGELFAVYVPRSEMDIQTSLDFFRSLSKEASGDLSEWRRLSADADGRLKILNEEIKTSKTRRDVAKKTGDGSQRAELDKALKQQERERDYLQHMKLTLQTNVDRLLSDQAAADANVKALGLELDVARKHTQMSVGNPIATEISAYHDMLRSMLDAQRTAGDQFSRAGDLRKRVAEQQLRQLQSLDKVSSPK